MVKKKRHNEQLKDFYTKQNRLFKPMNVLLRNSRRLDNTSYEDAIDELLKNSIEHGNRFISIKEVETPEYRIEIFNSMSEDKLESITFKQILEHLTSFQEIRDDNFHEGLTTLLLFKAEIRCKNYFIRNKKSDDGYYQYIENTSHVLDDNLNEICLEKIPYTDGWQVMIYPENKKDHNLFHLINERLNSFYFLENNRYNIQIGGNYFRANIFNHSNQLVSANVRGWLFYKLQLETSKSSKVNVFWRLNTKNVFHMLQNKFFSNRNISGSIILTSIRQFANENRHEIHESLQEFLDHKIEEIRQINQLENQYLICLENYDEYKYQYSQFLSQFFILDKYNSTNQYKPEFIAKKLFNDKDKEKSLLQASEFLYTLKEISQIGNKIKIIFPELILHPSKTPVPMEKKDFIRLIDQLSFKIEDLRKVLYNIPIGIKIINGDPEGFIMCGEIDSLLMEQRVLQLIDTSLSFSEILHFDNDFPVIYLIHPMLELLLCDIQLRHIKSPNQYKQFPHFNRSIFPQLKDFAIHFEYSLDSYKNKQKRKNKKNFNDNQKISPVNELNLALNFELSSQTKISSMKVNETTLNHIKYELNVFQFTGNGQYTKIPMFYKSNSKNKVDSFLKDPAYMNSSLIQNFLLFSKATCLLIDNFQQFPKKTVYPILLYDENNTFASYIKESGIILFNVLKFPDFDDNISRIFYFLDIISHEVAHELVSTHGKKHEDIMQTLLRISKGKDKKTKKYIYKILLEVFS